MVFDGGFLVLHMILPVSPPRTGLEVAGLGSLWGNPSDDAVNVALPLIPTHGKDKSKLLRDEALKNQLLHHTPFLC